MILLDCSNFGFVSFTILIVVQSNSKGSGNLWSVTQAKTPLSLGREVLEGPVVVPGEPPLTGRYLTCLHPPCRNLYTERSYSPGKLGMQIYMGLGVRIPFLRLWFLRPEHF